MLYDSEISNKKQWGSLTDLIIQTGEWIYALERLKQGRWKRFRAPYSKLRGITGLQLKIADFAFEVYRLLESFYDISAFNKKLKTNMISLTEACRNLEQYAVSGRPNKPNKGKEDKNG